MNWKTIKKAELQSLYPSSDGGITEIETLRQALEQFVQSPRNHERKSVAESLMPKNWSRSLPHSHKTPVKRGESPFHLVTYHGFGVRDFETVFSLISLDKPEIADMIHSIITHPKYEETE